MGTSNDGFAIAIVGNLVSEVPKGMMYYLDMWQALEGGRAKVHRNWDCATWHKMMLNSHYDDMLQKSIQHMDLLLLFLVHSSLFPHAAAGLRYYQDPLCTKVGKEHNLAEHIRLHNVMNFKEADLVKLAMEHSKPLMIVSAASEGTRVSPTGTPAWVHLLDTDGWVIQEVDMCR